MASRVIGDLGSCKDQRPKREHENQEQPNEKVFPQSMLRKRNVERWRKHRAESTGEGEMKTKQKKITKIHNSLLDGQRKQMCDLIDEYGLYDFWSDYLTYLLEKDELSGYDESEGYFADATISYHRIRNR